MSPVRLSLGPLLYYWPREQVERFYEEAAAAPIDVVYLGEVVCGKRHELKHADWIALAERLRAAGKEVVLSTLALPESETDLRVTRRLVEHGALAIEANDMGAASLAASAGLPFVIGPHVNVYNASSLACLQRLGGFRWVPPVELSGRSIAETIEALEAPVELELFAYGRLPLALSARCFTARAYERSKDDCDFRCIDHPDGIATTTIDHAPAFALNGVQVQSLRPHSVAPMLADVLACGVNVLRISPQGRHTLEVAALFREALDGIAQSEDLAKRIDERVGSIASCGYWQGRPGAEVRGPVRR